MEAAMPGNQSISVSDAVLCGVLLGVAGSVAEVLWIASYALLAGGNALAIAHGVSATVGRLLPVDPFASAPILFGVLIHMVAAVGIGIALALGWRALTALRSLRGNEFAFMMAALAIVWAFSFFFVLPALNPAFVLLVPYPVSFVSKLLFGVAAAAALRYGAAAGFASAFTPARAGRSNRG
jgi:hypothetical protein